jgi:acyl dehydratase
MDETFASKTEFGGWIAHGPLIFSLGTGMISSTGFYGDSVMAWIGVESMRIPNRSLLGTPFKPKGLF